MFQDWVNVDRSVEGIRGSAIGFSGDEASGWYTYKQFSTLVTLLYDHPPGWVPAPTSPANPSVVTSTTPTLSIPGVTDPEGLPVRYYFRLSTGVDGESGQVINSGWLAAGTTTWTVPTGSLRDGVTYYWHVYTWEDGAYVSIQTIRKPIDYNSSPGQWIVWNFKVDLRLGAGGPSPTDQAGPATVNLATGNLSVGAATPSLPTVGGSAGLSFTYNSMQPVDQGLRGAYYWDANNNQVFGDDGNPVLTRTDPQVSFDWGTGAPSPAMLPDYFLVRWTGYITVPTTGVWNLGHTGDDGVQIRVNDVVVQSNWTDGPIVFPAYSGPVALTAGAAQKIQVDYYERTGNANIQLWAKDPSGTELQVPASWLSTDASTMPAGWTMSAGDVNLAYSAARVQDTSITLVGDDGSTSEYKKASTGGFTPPKGQDDILSVASDGTISVQADDARTYTFTAQGVLSAVTSGTDDRTPAAISYTWSTPAGAPPRLTTMGDPVSGQTATLSYGGDASCPSTPPSGLAVAPVGLLCQISFWDGTQSKLWYTTGSRLGRLENPGWAVTDFAYDANGRIQALRDSLAADAVAAGVRANDDTTRTVITYDATGRVASTTLPEPTAGAARPAKTYNYTSATTTDVVVAGLTMPLGYSRRVAFDSTWRKTSDTDATGKVTTSEWDPQDRLKGTVDPAGLRSTTLYDAAQRPTDTYGPAPTANFSGDVGDATVPHSQTFYDENIPTLAAAYWNNKDLTGQPKLHGTGIGHPQGDIGHDWGAGSPDASLTPDLWGLRLTGDIRLDSVGTYAFRAFADGGVRIYVDDILLVDRWSDPGNSVNPTADGQFANTVAGSKHRLRVDYFDETGNANLFLHWTPPGASAAEIPGSFLSPRYGLTTKTIDADGKTTSTGYTDSTTGIGPEFGLPTKQTVDPSGLNLQTTTTYEAPGAGSFLRRRYTTMPSDGGTTGNSQTEDVYYGASEPVTNPCTGGATINQAGRKKYDRAAVPGGPDARLQRETVYDTAGRSVATRIANEAWTCTSYDSRGRPTTVSYPAYGGQSARTVTNTYAVGANPLVTAVADPAGTITTTVDLLGRVVSYTDVWGKTTTTTYDQAGRVITTVTTGQFPMNYDYDPAGRLELTKLLTLPMADPVYDSAGRLQSVGYPVGIGQRRQRRGRGVWLRQFGSAQRPNLGRARILAAHLGRGDAHHRR
jgi:YD repeat-containing protein